VQASRDNVWTVSNLALFLFFASLPQIAFAHGIRVAASVGAEAITGVASYADGSPIKNASAELSGTEPSGGSLVLAQGRSNDEGRFAIPTPSVPGHFIVTIDDGLGHRGTLTVRIADTHLIPPVTGAVSIGSQTERGPSTESRWLSGLGYVLGLFGTAALWFSRRDSTRP
jgi:hypothetical protein